ncbi:MAG: gliding motility-associated C-terminal domain-containing protein [Ginsengibacter sp.]
MRYLLILMLSVVSMQTSRAQNVNFNWVKKLERQIGLPVQEGYFIGTDAAKNVYLAGNFHNTIDLDPGPGITNVSSQFENIFISKFSSAGIFIWGKNLGKNDNYTVCKSLSVDATGNVYATGYFTGTADFDPGPDVYNLTSTTTAGLENNNVFICRLDPNGNFKWAKQIGENNVDIGNSINADIFGNVYTTGYITGAVDLDPGSGSALKGSSNMVTAFIIKLDAAGNFKFAKAFEGDHYSEGKYIRTDSKGNIYTSGYFGGVTDFDPGAGVRNFTTDAIFTQKDFLSKLDSSGNFLWAIRDIIGLDIAVDDNENVYSYYSELSKYDINGNLVWKKSIGGSPDFTYSHNDIQVDRTGSIYLSGLFRFTQDFDPGLSIYNLTTNGGGYASDIFVSKLSGDGNFIYAKSFGGSDEDYATGLCVNTNGEVYTTGVFVEQVDFDPGLEEYEVTGSIFGNVFIHKMSPCKNISTARLDIISCKSYILNNIIYDSSGSYMQTLTTTTGCDSVINLNLQINIAASNVSIVTCTDYSWNGRLLAKSGKYSDTLQTQAGCDSITSLDLVINRLSSTINKTICKGQSHNGHTVTGIYTDTFATANGCDSVVSLQLNVLEKPAPDLGADTEICAGDLITLKPGTFQSYQWQDGSTQDTFIVKKAGFYSLTVTNLCGAGSDEINIIDGVCKMYFPNVFTPDNNGINDRFMLLHPDDLSNFWLLIYNRNGEKVFETKDYTEPWSGMYKGSPAPAGIYVWYSKFNQAGISRELKGTVLLLK